MSVSEDIVDGIVCMRCQQMLVSDAGELCDAGHPLFCEECWKKDKRARKEGAPYWQSETGTIATG